MDIRQLSINTIRTLSMDAVQKANSGHPGAPMGMAALGYTIWQNFLCYDPKDIHWPNRDRFVLSNGHASMLLYSLLHLTGVEDKGKPAISLDDIKHFRQWGSKTPGHPEYNLVPGVETTTGPLGQGYANSVGMAIAERWLAKHFNKPGFDIFNYNIFAIGGDGCMMEGVSSEAASLAAHLRLSNLCWFYDNNKISIEGKTDLAFSEDVGARFEAYGWKVLKVHDGNDVGLISEAIEIFKNTTDRPTLIIVDTHIGFGSPHKQDTKSAHGEPLGTEEIKLTKKAYGWPEDSQFLVPDGVMAHFAEGFGRRGEKLNTEWKTLLKNYQAKFPELAHELDLLERRALPEGWDKNLPVFPADSKGLATRDTSGKVMNEVAKNIPWFMGGAADLAPSTKTLLEFEGAGKFSSEDYGGRNFHFGIREHAMGAIINGMTLSKLRTYGATFLIFSDYQKPPIRLSSLMEIPAIYIFTHDSIGVGEDGPTHQPIEQLASLRAVPGLAVFRPADANEVTETWRTITKLSHQPVALSLSRQPLPTIDRTKYHSADGVKFGAYIVAGDINEKPQVLLLATGGEVSLCLESYEKLKSAGLKARVVSMPSWDFFEKQSEDYKAKVLPPDVKARVSVETAGTFGWAHYTGLTGKNIGMSTFGASAPIKELYTHFGFTVEKIVEAAREQIELNRGS